ncbi:hypothetical protein BOX37_30990 [Nocardia mangyaensis]|uniref:Uncharacterized protein n=1 Tax=Nocardia mangyaensis TaxID=2213200 RepID=A0A1J0W080_9NOCA|nr:hypothetical protein [Nocardia mangyaensis]APE37625.1 hypothetical protein BOX37_30990 [Nocardia mangyaensis]
MATGVGLRIADDECIAAVVTEDGSATFVARESVLHMSDDGDAALGGPAPNEHAHSVAGFVRAIGDPAGVDVDGGEAYRAEDLLATAMFCLIDLTTEHLSGPAEFYATHPAQWSPEIVRGVREALDYLGLKSVALLGEDELPQPVHGGDPGRTYATAAAEAALVAVLATPAGATPPDPIVTENSLVVTDVMPALATPVVTAQAYSAALPVASLPTKSMDVPVAAAAVPVETPPPARSRTPLLIAAAALVGLLLGAVAVSVALRGGEPVTPPPISDARTEQSTEPPAPAPLPPPPAPAPVVESTTPAPVVVPTTDEPPAPAPAPPPPAEEPAPEPEPEAEQTTTEEQPDAGSSSTTRSPWPFRNYPPDYLPPPLTIPGTR